MLASARKMLEVIPKAALNGGDGKFKPHQQSKLYGEVVDQHKEFDREKLRAAMKRQRQQEEDVALAKDGKNKRKYNSSSVEVDWRTWTMRSCWITRNKLTSSKH